MPGGGAPEGPAAAASSTPRATPSLAVAARVCASNAASVCRMSSPPPLNGAQLKPGAPPPARPPGACRVGARRFVSGGRQRARPLSQLHACRCVAPCPRCAMRRDSSSVSCCAAAASLADSCCAAPWRAACSGAFFLLVRFRAADAIGSNGSAGALRGARALRQRPQPTAATAARQAATQRCAGGFTRLLAAPLAPPVGGAAVGVKPLSASAGARAPRHNPVMLCAPRVRAAPRRAAAARRERARTIEQRVQLRVALARHCSGSAATKWPTPGRPRPRWCRLRSQSRSNRSAAA